MFLSLIRLEDADGNGVFLIDLLNTISLKFVFQIQFSSSGITLTILGIFELNVSGINGKVQAKSGLNKILSSIAKNGSFPSSAQVMILILTENRVGV